MVNMAAMPIYGKNHSKIFQFDFHETWYVASGTPAHSNDDPGVTLTYFTARSNLVTRLFYGKMGKQWIFKKLLQPVA